MFLSFTDNNPTNQDTLLFNKAPLFNQKPNRLKLIEHTTCVFKLLFKLEHNVPIEPNFSK